MILNWNFTGIQIEEWIVDTFVGDSKVFKSVWMAIAYCLVWSTRWQCRGGSYWRKHVMRWIGRWLHYGMLIVSGNSQCRIVSEWRCGWSWMMWVYIEEWEAWLRTLLTQHLWEYMGSCERPYIIFMILWNGSEFERTWWWWYNIGYSNYSYIDVLRVNVFQKVSVESGWDGKQWTWFFIGCLEISNKLKTFWVISENPENVTRNILVFRTFF